MLLLIVCLAACSPSAVQEKTPASYQVSGMAAAVPSVTQVVGSGAGVIEESTEQTTADLQQIVSFTYSYGQADDPVSCLSAYCGELAGSYGFTVQTPLDAEHPGQDTVLTFPAENGQTIVMTLRVTGTNGYQVHMQGILPADTSASSQ